MNKKTKIVATIGPRTETVDMLSKLVHAGLDVARLNMSHGDQAEHASRIKNIREAEKKTGKRIAILQDLSGPKIRTGEYTTERITIEAGKKIILTTEKIVGDVKKIYINYPKLPQEVKKGNFIMLDDGKKQLVVEKVIGNEIHCKVVVGGELKARRGVNIPGAYLSVSSITEKDKKDLAFGLKQGVDLIALSFVRRAEDVLELKAMLKKAKKNIPVISKIETQEAMDNLDAILEVSDGAMVARGDLAIEVPTEMVPLYQKEIIAKCNALGKPVITATQMLESMIQSPVPTRAEVSDIANAIFDGTDAVMLSEESTLGMYPIEAVTMMGKIAHAVELEDFEAEAVETVTDAISDAISQIVTQVGARAIVALTETGTTARMVARFGPDAPIYAFTPHEKTARELMVVSGVYPAVIEKLSSFEQALAFVPKYLKENKLAKKGDKIVLTAGMPFGVTGSTNMMFVLTI